LAYNVERERSNSVQNQMNNELQREITIAKMAQDGEMTREELERKERLEMLKLQNSREMFNAEAALRVKTGAGI
jgi:transcriptional regulator GlxA family with amidase domain